MNALDVYHYTAGLRVPAIFDSGELRTGNVGADGEKPLLWFSSHSRWEPTSTKLMRSNTGQVRVLSFDEQLAKAGCVRFVLSGDDQRLMRWAEACAYAGTPRETRRRLEQYGKKIGASPVQWLATAVNVPLSDVAFQVFRSGAWHDADIAATADHWR